MNKKHFINFWQRLAAIAVITLSNNLFAADCSSEIKAVTNKDAGVSLEVLSYHVIPLTKCELEVEAQAWLNLLQNKVAEISNAQIAAIYKEEEISAAEDMAEALEDGKRKH